MAAGVLNCEEFTIEVKQGNRKIVNIDKMRVTRPHFIFRNDVYPASGHRLTI